MAIKNGLRTIAFTNISTGIYGYPKQNAAIIAFETVQNFLLKHTELERVIFCCFDEENFKIYTDFLSDYTVIKQVITTEEIFITSNLAASIWNEYYISIISQEQIDYMVNKFQSPEAIENQIKGDCYQYYIIYHDSVPSGYISIKPSGNELFLSKFYVIKEKRGTGLGRKGIEFISEKAKECGARTITLTVNKNNISSIKAYEKLGFVNGGPVVADIGNGYVMDDFRMSLKL